jgi:hypothetical protein
MAPGNVQARIHHHEVGGHEHLPRVEERDPARGCEPVPEVLRSDPALVETTAARGEPKRGESHREGQREEWRHPPSIATREGSTLPGARREHHHRKADAGGLRAQRQEERNQRRRIAPRSRRLVVAEEERERDEPEEECERVLDLAHPRDRRHVDRVHGEDQGGRPRRRHAQPREQPPQQDRVQRVEQHVRPVEAIRDRLDGGDLRVLVSRRVPAPFSAEHPPFEPEDRGSERPEAARGTGSHSEMRCQPDGGRRIGHHASRIRSES